MVQALAADPRTEPDCVCDVEAGGTAFTIACGTLRADVAAWLLSLPDTNTRTASARAWCPTQLGS